MSRATPVGSLWTGPVGDPRRYRVDLDAGALRSAGDGGEGLVYRATGTVDGTERDVALKMLTTLAVDDYAQVAARARLLEQIDSPHVMRQRETFVGPALGDGEDPDADDFDVIYTVADWVPGVPLDVAVRDADVASGLRWVAQVARGVDALHAFHGPDAPDGIVHRDIKPSNVRVTDDGDAVLIDFGIARPHATNDLTEGAGTYLWRAPEVVGGPGAPGPASDAWAVGALAHWVLAGEPPRLEPAAATRAQLVRLAASAGFANAPDLARHVALLLEPHPDRRRGDLDRWADELDGIVARRNRTSWSRRPAFLVAAGLAAGIVVGVGVAVVAGRLDTGSSTHPPPGAPGSALRLAPQFAVPDSRAGDVVLTQTRTVDYREGPVLLTGNRAGTRDLLVNDELELRVTHPDGQSRTFTFNAGAASDCRQDDVLAPTDVGSYFVPGRNTVQLTIRGGCNGADIGEGGFAGAGTPIWLRFGS